MYYILSRIFGKDEGFICVLYIQYYSVFLGKMRYIYIIIQHYSV